VIWSYQSLRFSQKLNQDEFCKIKPASKTDSDGTKDKHSFHGQMVGLQDKPKKG
jgi:hypothetical protein